MASRPTSMDAKANQMVTLCDLVYTDSQLLLHSDSRWQFPARLSLTNLRPKQSDVPCAAVRLRAYLHHGAGFQHKVHEAASRLPDLTLEWGMVYRSVKVELRSIFVFDNAVIPSALWVVWVSCIAHVQCKCISWMLFVHITSNLRLSEHIKTMQKSRAVLICACFSFRLLGAVFFQWSWKFRLDLLFLSERSWIIKVGLSENGIPPIYTMVYQSFLD